MMFPTTSSRVGELGLNIYLVFLGGKELGFRDFEKLRDRNIAGFGMDGKFSLRVPLNRWDALSTKSRH